MANTLPFGGGCFLFGFLSVLCFFALHVSSQSSPDSSVMGKLKTSLKLPSSLDWSDPDPCQWTNVRCENHRITRIQIPSKNVGGTLPPDLKDLSQLKVFEVMNNQISGPIPSLAGLSLLEEANFHDNNFSSFPSDFFTGLTSLTAIYLDNNPFEPWQVPESIKEATSLKAFSANKANLNGRFPSLFDLATFPGLTDLHVAMNNLEGELPASLAGSMIQSFWANGQRLNGTIQVIQNMSSLREVWLNMNQFTGPLPDFSMLTQLSNLSLRDNQLTGVVPSSLINLKSLYMVNLTNNKLQGPTPKFADGVLLDMRAGSNRFCLDDPGVACDERVTILLSIMEAFGYPENFADNWKGNDPCNDWLGISCVQGNIVSILFAKKGLTGTISSNFAKLDSLTTLDLAGNNLTGTIPTELTTLPKLVRLDVSNNRLYGKVPPFRQNVAVITAGNPDIGKEMASPPAGKSPGGSPAGGGGGGSSSGNGEKKLNTGTVVGSAIGAVGGLSLLVLGICLYARKGKRTSKVQSPTTVVIHPHHSGDQDGVKITVAGSSVTGGSETTFSHTSSGPSDVHLVEAGNMVISIQVLRDVTNNFSEENVLGRGGFGTVYKGELHDGTKIAVKRMESSVVSEKGLAEFKSEIAVLTKVRHRHLVTLLGYCLDGNERLLVYEYMPQGTLSRHLFNWKHEGLKPLEWTRRLTIALDVARGVEYLHGLAQQSFIHRDLKPSNILLGDDMRAKVADFGLVRLAPVDGKQSIETRLAGTFGYLAPEYAVTGRVTTKVDVFSFGVILMELISGRRALDETQPEESMHLVSWFRRMHMNKDTFRKAIDETIQLDEETLASVSTVIELAGHCCAREPYQRPDMSHAVNVLSSLAELWKPAEPDSDDIYGIDLELTLPQALKKWQAFEGTYLTSIARSHAIDTGLHEGTVIGNFNGEFWAVFALHQFVGNLITLAVLPKGTEGSTGSTTLLFIVFLCSMTLGTILMCFIRKTNDKEKVSEDSSVSFCSAVASRLSSVILPLLDMRMLLVIPLIAYSGLQQAFVWASYTKDIVNPTLGEAGVGGAMAVYGAFDAICSLAAGRLTSGLRSITIIVCGGAFFQALIFLWLLLKYSATSGVLGVIYPLLMAAFLGIGDGVLNTQLSALLALLFKHDTEGAFAQLKVWQSSAIAVVFFLSPVVTLQTMVEIMIGAISVSLVSFLFLTLKVEKAFSSHQVTNM